MRSPVLFGEALALGLASGPACIAACGPVFVPSMLAAQSGWRSNARTLGVFLAGRLAGYMLFALIAWQAGLRASLLGSPSRSAVGCIYVLLAVVLAWCAVSPRRHCAAVCRGPRLVAIDTPKVSMAPSTGRVGGPAALGFLTGLNLCPPFVVAGVRAAAAGSAQGSLLFFVFFFVGTAVWFLPFAGLGYVGRSAAVLTVARMTMALIGVYYLATGLVLALRPIL